MVRLDGAGVADIIGYWTPVALLGFRLRFRVRINVRVRNRNRVKLKLR